MAPRSPTRRAPRATPGDGRRDRPRDAVADASAANDGVAPADGPRPPRFARWLTERTDAADLATKGDRTRLALKAAAARLLEERGHDGFSTGDVADLAQVTRTAFYKYFASRHALVLELIEDFQAFMVEALQVRRTRGDEAGNTLRMNLAYVRFFAVNARVLLSMQQVRASLPDAERLRFDLNDWWAHKIAARIGGRPPAKRRRAVAGAYALEAMVDGFLTELYVRRNPYLLALELSEAEIARTLSDAWEGAIARLRGPTGEG
ncbi:MAG TPA: TetR/AcrR family transcriptional regulator [Burkholderiaceae bacterium]|nr:TetR/AcrR family transcriptional regulator [Burkholderiaceae bacterium]